MIGIELNGQLESTPCILKLSEILWGNVGLAPLSPSWFWYPNSFEIHGYLLSCGKLVNFPNRWKVSASVNWLYMGVDVLLHLPRFTAAEGFTLERLSADPGGPNVFFAILLKKPPSILLHAYELLVVWSSAHVCLGCVPPRKVPTYPWIQRVLWRCGLLPSKCNRNFIDNVLSLPKLKVTFSYNWPCCRTFQWCWS